MIELEFKRIECEIFKNRNVHNSVQNKAKKNFMRKEINSIFKQILCEKIKRKENFIEKEK